MKYYLTTLFLLLFTALLHAQVATPSQFGRVKGGSSIMYQPRALLSAYDAEKLVAVELGEWETRVVAHALGWDVPAATFASDEAGRHYSLLRIEERGTDLVLVFKPLPQTTRLMDIVFEGTQRQWVGIHSGTRSLQFPSIRPRFDENATLPDSIKAVLRANALADLLSSDSLYTAVYRQLPTFRNYIAWKYKLTAHQVFLLQRETERNRPVSDASTGDERQRSTSSQAGGSSRAGASESSLRTLPRAPKPTRRQLKRLSRFEQKMIQEQRRPQP